MEEGSPKKWNQFVVENKGSFLQSYEWAEFQKKCGKQSRRLKLDGLQAVAIKEKFSFYIPYGPVAAGRSALPLLFDKVRNECAFLRVEPYSGLEIDVGRQSFKRTQPQRTLLLNLNRSEEEILAGFQKTCRYNIGLAERKGVEVLIKDEYCPDFYKILKQTAGRNNFKLHKESHYRNLFEARSEDFEVKMFLGRFGGETIAAYIMVLFGGVATALHGSFNAGYKKLKPANLLTWERIKYAKKKGCSEFDFWGIDEKRWPGFTEFKKSFGGREVLYPEAKDIVFDSYKYGIYKFLRRIL